MNINRPLVLAAFVALIVSGCSRTVKTPERHTHMPLAPQVLGTTGDDYGVEVAVNRDLGAIFVVGSTQGSLDGPNKGGYDGFLRRYNRDGLVAWRRQFGSTGDDSPAGVATDRAGTAYVATTSQRSDTGYKTATLKKFSKSGTLLWTRFFDMDAYEETQGTEANAVATDGAGNVYVGANTFTQSHVRKYSSSGALLWTRSADTWAVMTQVEAMTTDRDGNLYVSVGEYDDESFSSTIVKYSGSGSVLWSKAVGNDRGVVDLQVVGSALYAAGYKTYFDGTVPHDAYAAKFSLDGRVVWDITFGTSESELGTGVTADGSGNAYISGRTTGALIGRNAGGWDGFVRKYSPSGKVVWTKQFGSAAFDMPEDLVAYNGSELYLTGSTYGKLGSAHRGGEDAFLRRLDGSGRVVRTDQ